MRFLKYHLRGNVYYAAIDPGGGGGGAPAGQPAGAPTPGAQPGGQGNGQGGDFRSQFFPNVPDEIWSTVEPHVRGVQGHVTQLEQKYAPFKGYRDQDLQGLAEFSQAFDRDPVGQWIRMAQGLQDAGVLDSELDLQHLSALVTGQMPAKPAAPGPQAPPENGDMPEWARQLNQRLDSLEGGVNKFQTDQRTQVEDAVLKRQVAGIKDTMKKAGIADGTFSEEAILASYIAHRGNAAAAAKSFVDARTAMLKGYVRQQTNPNDPTNPQQSNNNDLDLPNGAPQARTAPKRRGGSSRDRMIPKETVAAAEQFLRGQGS